MPTSTARFCFEFRLFDWAEGLSRRLAGGRQPMFVGIRADQSLRRIYFARPGESFDGDAKNKLVEAHPVWFQYAPYPELGAGYLEWFALESPTAERWLESSIGPEDLLDVRASGNRATWPKSW